MSWPARLAWWRELAGRGKLHWYVAARLLAYSGLSRFFLIPQRGYRLRFHPSSMSSVLWTDPANRQDDEAFLRRYLRPGDLVVDAGANIGNLTLASALCVGASGRVVAIEAHPVTYGFLQNNLALNQVTWVDTFNVALGESRGHVVLSSGADDDQNAVVESGSGGLETPLEPLDDLPLPEGTIALRKADVEGYEEQVFRGASATLHRTRCVLFESWERHCARYGRRASGAWELLEHHGFSCFTLDASGELTPIAPDHRSETCENLVAVRSVEEFTARWGAPIMREDMSTCAG